MREKLILVSFGALLGLFFVGLAYRPLQALYVKLALSEGQRFESVDDVRRAISAGLGESKGTTNLRDLISPNPSDQIIYELKPNLSLRFQRAQVQTNSFGMRGPEITLEKPPDTYRIAVLGDSYTFGWGVPEESSFPRVMEERLNSSQVMPKKVQVLNFGVPGYSTFQEVAQFMEKGQRFQPDAALVYFIHNDFALPFFIRDLTADDPGLLTSAFDFAGMKVGHDAQKSARRKELLRSLDAVRALFTLGEFCKSRGIRLFVVLHPSRHEKDLQNKLWELREPRGRELMTFLSISQEYRDGISSGSIPQERLKLKGDEHPGPGAQELIGQLLAAKLEGVFAAETPPTR